MTTETTEADVQPDADQSTVAAPMFQVLKGNPTDEDIAALVTVLAAASGGAGDTGSAEYNMWGHPVSKLRFAVTSWQLTTLVERTYVRR